MALVVLPPLTGCAIQYAEEEAQLRYNAADDSLDFLLVYRGITASDEREKTVNEALSIVQRLLDGSRTFASPWGNFDLDDPGLSKDDDADLAQVAAAISLLDWGLFLDKEERLSGFQQFRLANVSLAVECLNRRISKWVVEAAADENFAANTPLLDDRTRELLCCRARSGEPWLYLVDGEIQIDVPMTRESWDRVQKAAIAEMTSAANAGSAAWLGQHLVYLRHFEIEDERVILALGAPVSGVYRFASKDAGVKYSSQLKEALTSSGVTFETLQEKLDLETE